MQIIGFNITKISANKDADLKKSAINTDILFNNVEKQKINLLKDSEALKTDFTFSVNFKEQANQDSKTINKVSFDGNLILAVSKDEEKEFTKSWKNKEVPKTHILPLYNYILRKCSVRAMQIEEELGLPSHMPFPQIRSETINK